MKRTYLTLFIFTYVLVCKSQDYTMVGESFDFIDPINISEALQNNYETEVIVKANVNAVCKVKGCWMTLVEKENDQELFVKFKDYAFFMPLDLDGEVVVKGVISKKTISVEELRHYAEDAGKSTEEIMAIVKPKEEYHMLATGVAILN